MKLFFGFFGIALAMLSGATNAQDRTEHGASTVLWFDGLTTGTVFINGSSAQVMYEKLDVQVETPFRGVHLKVGSNVRCELRLAPIDQYMCLLRLNSDGSVGDPMDGW